MSQKALAYPIVIIIMNQTSNCFGKTNIRLFNYVHTYILQQGSNINTFITCTLLGLSIGYLKTSCYLEFKFNTKINLSYDATLIALHLKTL